MNDRNATPVLALARFGLNSPNARRLVDFYERAFDARLQTAERHDARQSNGCSGVLGASCMLLRVGISMLEILEFNRPGQAYPAELSPYDNRFQHCALVVHDMQAALERLDQIEGWRPISSQGPQTLPPQSGAVTAFKLRDPDGHPLELLQFPADKIPEYWRNQVEFGVVAGIDHSAISVAQVDRSVDFYEALGLRPTVRTLNLGVEQERLDGVSGPEVDVVGLSAETATPHLELLHYRTVSRPPYAELASNDIPATRLIFTTRDSTTQRRGPLKQDPDGHYLEILDGADHQPIHKS